MAVLLVALGTPDEPTAPALRRYLAEFLGDPRVVEIPRLLWWPILHGIVLRVRPAKSAAKYASIWTPEGSPLAVWTQRQTAALARELAGRGHQLLVRHAMRYGRPGMPAVLDELQAAGATRVLVLPLYPQYAGATAASVADRLAQWLQATPGAPAHRFVADFHEDPGYIAALAQRLHSHWQAQGRGERLVLSFHGIPQRSVDRGDPYQRQCLQTARLLTQHLGLTEQEVLVTFQSRFGKAAWLQPYTEPTLCRLAAEGVRRVDVMCPGFVADCLETLEEIAQEARDAFIAAGGQALHYVPCLNDDPAWISALATLAEGQLQGWPTRPAA